MEKNRCGNDAENIKKNPVQQNEEAEYRMKVFGESILTMKNIHVFYGSQKALNGVGFDLNSGEIHAIAGEHRA